MHAVHWQLTLNTVAGATHFVYAQFFSATHDCDV